MEAINTPESEQAARKMVQVLEKQSQFQTELKGLINKYNLENESNTPDFILAEYLADCLQTFDIAVRSREKWYGRVNRHLA